MRDVEIDSSVAVVVTEGGAGAPAAPLQTGEGGDVPEPAAAQVPVQDVAAEAGEEQIDAAVVVVVGEHAPLRPVAARGDARPLGDVLERAVAAVAVERGARLLAGRERPGARAVGKEHVDPAVAVHVVQACAVAHGLVDRGLLDLAADVQKRQPRLTGHVQEAWPRAALRRRRRRRRRRRDGRGGGHRERQGDARRDDEGGRGPPRRVHRPALSRPWQRLHACSRGVS